MSTTPNAGAAKPLGTTPGIYIPSKPGEELGVGVVIEEVIQISDRCGVYITRGNKLHWIYEYGRCVDAERSISVAVELLTQLKSLPISEASQRRGLKIVGTALHDAFMSRMENDKRNYFKSAKEFIDLRQREAIQMNYFAIALLTVLTAIGGLLFLAQVDAVQPYAIAGMMGGVGAFVSVAQRFRSIPIDRYSSFSYTALGGLSRILFGIIFGAIFRLMQEAGLIMNAASTNPAMLAIGSFVAGFSERLIPDLLQQFETGFRYAGRVPKAGMHRHGRRVDVATSTPLDPAG